MYKKNIDHFDKNQKHKFIGLITGSCRNETYKKDILDRAIFRIKFKERKQEKL